MRLLLTSEACRMLRVSPRTLRQMVREGVLPVVTLPGTSAPRFDEGALTEVVKRHTRRTA